MTSSFRVLTIRLLVAVTGVLGLLGGVQAATASAGPMPLRGLQVSRPFSAAAITDLDHAKTLGAQMVRTEIPWNVLEPAAPGQQDPTALATTDAFMAAAKARKLKVLVVVVGTPCWASSAPAELRDHCAEKFDEVASYPPTSPKPFADVMAFLAKRYKSTITALEVWNEPDQGSEDYFAGPDKPKRYAAMLKAAYPAIKKVAPNITVLGGSIVGANGEFLKALYKEGIKGYYDALSVHYYDLVLASLRSIRDFQNKAHDKKPIWLAEFGWSSCYPGATTQGGQNCTTAKQEGPNILDIFRALRKVSYVKAAVVYTLYDTTQYDFGLIDKAGKHKPAYDVLRKGWKDTKKKARPIVLHLKKSGGQIVATGTGPAGDAFEFDVYKAYDLRFKASFTLDRNGRFTLKLPKAVSKRGFRVLMYQYWAGGGVNRKLF